VLRDNPRLLSGNPSRQPRPVVLDTDLQFPLDSELLNQEKKPWIFYREGSQCSILANKKAALEAEGASLYQVPVDPSTGQLGLPEVLQILYDELDIAKATVEGGVSLLESFIRSGLFDKLVVLMTPCFGVGRALFQAHTSSDAISEALRARLPKLINVRYDVLGGDLVMTAEPEP
jgi:riboflavin biosynthesis pyrimidine reductase